MAGTRGSGISPVQQEYLDVLRSAMWGEVLPSLPKDLEGVLRIADQQKTRPQVLDALQKAGYEDLESLNLIYRNTSTHVKTNRNIARLVTLLRAAGIEPVLLKGQGVALNYPEPMLRECGDIDLYVGPELYDKAFELVRSQESVREMKSLTEKHSILVYKGSIVEIHRESAITDSKRLNARFQSIADKGLSQNLVPVVINEVPVNTPADSFNAFYLFYHFLTHAVYGGLGLRQICDWTLFLHSRSGKLDTGEVGQALDSTGLRRAWQLYASVAVDYLGLPATEMPFYKAGLAGQGAKALGLIFEDGNFGQAMDFTKGRPKGLLSGKLFSMKKILNRFRTLYGLLADLRPLIFRVGMQYLFGGMGRVSEDSMKK